VGFTAYREIDRIQVLIARKPEGQVFAARNLLLELCDLLLLLCDGFVLLCVFGFKFSNTADDIADSIGYIGEAEGGREGHPEQGYRAEYKH
jgi:hypothetical protein